MFRDIRQLVSLLVARGPMAAPVTGWAALARGFLMPRCVLITHKSAPSF